jgi:aminopeptidase N
MGKKVTRLFEQFQPAHYELSLVPDRNAMTFTGSVTIDGKKTGRPSERITFHQKELKIVSATIVRHDKKGDETFDVRRINTHKSFNEVRLHAGQLLYPGNYTVTLQFSGKITRPMNGIYPCFFKQGGADKVLIATQFESHHAREAFPCIDEPEAKATFDLTLTTPGGETVLANTPVKSQRSTGSTTVTSFETTPKMSTYLLAFIYGELDFLEAKTKSGVLVRTYATPDNVQFTQFALDVAVKCLDFYDEYFAIPYPLAKCDFIALPDFASGAMENWGCITFREQALFVDPKNTSLTMKQYVANVVAHELTHQWFGNLVTMQWWNDLWLNESFASWMSYLATDHNFPEWQVWTQFIVDEQLLALRQDALKNTHPIEVAINHPDEIRTIFDAISYEKGASVLHMLYGYIGAEAFRDGLRLYLKKHAYSNTVTTDLWAALEESSKQPVREFMHAWTAQAGYPLVSVEASKAGARLEQHRFVLNPKAQSSVPQTAWPIPLLRDEKDREVFERQEQTILTNSGTPVKLNHGQAGFYRTHYDGNTLQELGAEVSAGKHSPLDRMSILSDAFETAKAGYGSTVEALKLLTCYTEEDNIVVWDIISGGFGSLRMVMDDEDLREAMKPYVRELVVKQLTRLGWQERAEDSHFDRLLRPTILGLAAWADEPTVVKEALRQFNAMKAPEDVAPDLRGVVYGTAARLGDQKEFYKMLALHNASTNSEDRVTLSAALTAFEQEDIIKQALACITTDDVRLQDASYWVAYSFMNRHAKRITWDWLVTHWDWLEKNLGTDLSFYRMPNYAGRVFSDENFLPVFKEFFESHMSPAFERPVKQAIETIEWQAAWKNRDLNAVKEFFKL